MEYFRKMYWLLFNAVTDALNLLERREVEKAILHLQQAQQTTEDIYMSIIDEEYGNENEEI